MLIVHYEELKNFDKFSNTWKGKEDKKQADTLGHLLMAIGVNEISEKTVDEIIFRTKFLDFCWGSSFFVGTWNRKTTPKTADLRQLFKNHIGLRIEITNHGLKNISTRHKFMVNQLSTIEERIMKQINN